MAINIIDSNERFLLSTTFPALHFVTYNAERKVWFNNLNKPTKYSKLEMWTHSVGQEKGLGKTKQIFP